MVQRRAVPQRIRTSPALRVHATNRIIGYPDVVGSAVMSRQWTGLIALIHSMVVLMLPSLIHALSGARWIVTGKALPVGRIELLIQTQ